MNEVRNPHWPDVVNAFLNKNGKCLLCGNHDKLKVQNVIPFTFCRSIGRPDLELDERNLITVCELESNIQKNFEEFSYDEKKAYRRILDKEMPFNGPLGFRWPEPILFEQVVKKQ